MTHPIAVTTDNVHWQVASEHRDLLLGPDGLRLEEWLRAGCVRIIKQGPHRTVYLVVLHGLSFFVKHNRLNNVRAWLRQLVRPSKARKEFDHALAVAARGVPTFVPLAVGETHTRVGPGDSFLVTRSLEGTEPVDTFIETTLPQFSPARRARIGQRLARELGKLVARMHHAGIAHQDFHAGNLLVRLAENDELSIHVIDLHALRVGAPLGWRAIRANLVMLNRWFVMRVSRSERLRFWLAYCQACAQPVREGQHGGLPSGVATMDLARELEKYTWASNLRFWRSRDRRCMLNNRYYRRVRAPAALGHAVTDLDAADLAALLADPDAPFRRPGIRLLKDSRSSTVAELEVRVAGVVRRVIYKRFRVTAWSDPWVALVRRAPALRSWVQGHGLRERCLPTARPLAVFHRRGAGLCHEGYLLTEKIEEAAELQRYLARLESLPLPERRGRVLHLITLVARLVRELHRRRLSHRDLKAANVLVSDSAGQASGLQCWLIDLVGVERFAKLPRSRRVQNLARLHASFHRSSLLTRTDKVRFLRVYLAWGLRGREGWKRWWHDIERATQAKIARNARNGRPLA